MQPTFVSWLGVEKHMCLLQGDNFLFSPIYTLLYLTILSLTSRLFSRAIDAQKGWYQTSNRLLALHSVKEHNGQCQKQFAIGLVSVKPNVSTPYYFQSGVHTTIVKEEYTSVYKDWNILLHANATSITERKEWTMPRDNQYLSCQKVLTAQKIILYKFIFLLSCCSLFLLCFQLFCHD